MTGLGKGNSGVIVLSSAAGHTALDYRYHDIAGRESHGTSVVGKAYC